MNNDNQSASHDVPVPTPVTDSAPSPFSNLSKDQTDKSSPAPKRSFLKDALYISESQVESFYKMYSLSKKVMPIVILIICVILSLAASVLGYLETR